MKKTQGCIFNIQKFSIHDGPGIRTVVFFKGCPLSCLWCSNPESQNSMTEITWDATKCIHCFSCVNICPNQAVIAGNQTIQIDNSKCTSCMSCINSCTVKAMNMEGMYKTIEEIVKEVMKDEMFYEESGGGVTLSGGEVLGQADFAIELLKALKEQNIHTACETTGYTSLEIFKKFIGNIDLLLFDVKHYDSQKHFENTGVYNGQIIENMTYASAIGKSVIARIPVIPGFNSELYDAGGFCKLLKTIGVSTVHLLPFHQFGENKYTLLGKEYKMKQVQQLNRDDLKEYQEVFLAGGFDCIV